MMSLSPATLLLAAMLLGTFAQTASAGPAMRLSRTAIDFSHVARQFTSPVQPLYVSNVGDAPLVVSGAIISGTNAEAFAVSGTCLPGATLAPGQFCRLDIVLSSAIATFTVTATLTVASNDPAPGTVALSGLIDPNYTGVPFIVPAPNFVEFGEQPAASSTMELSLSNQIPIRNVPPVPFVFNFLIAAARVVGNNSADFSVTSPCLATGRLYVGETCIFTVTFNPQQPGLRTAELVLDLVGAPNIPGAALTIPYALSGVGTAVAAVTVVEYYNATLDHYFITWLPAEIAALDAGTTIRGWIRTGKTFRTHTAAQAGTTAVCRFYIPPAKGDSHFFGRGAVECADTATKNPTFVLEDPAFMHMYLPEAGNCAAGTTRIYRAFSNRPDANHRYTTDPAVRDQMASLGWVIEGDGPDRVVMCGP